MPSSVKVLTSHPLSNKSFLFSYIALIVQKTYFFLFAYLFYMLSLCLPLDHKVHENKNIFCLICHNTLSLRRMLRMLKTLFKYLLQKENEKEKLVPGATFFSPSFVLFSFTPLSGSDFLFLHFTFCPPYRITWDMTVFTLWHIPKINLEFC